MIMAGQFKNAPIGFKQGMRFKTALGWREVLTVRDGTAICRTIGGEAPGFSWVYQEPTETMLLDLAQPWVGRKYKSHDGLVSEVVCMTDKQVFVQWAAETDPCAFTLDFFKKHFTPIPLEPPFKAGEWAIHNDKMVCIEHYITDSMVMVEEIGSALPPFSVPVDRLRRPNSTQEQPTPMNDPSCVRKYKGQKVVVIGTWGEWSWVAGEQSWKPFVVKTSDIAQ
jgi:hypothetical protein